MNDNEPFDLQLERLRRQADIDRADLTHIEDNALTLVAASIFLFAAGGGFFSLLAASGAGVPLGVGIPFLLGLAGVLISVLGLINVRLSSSVPQTGEGSNGDVEGPPQPVSSEREKPQAQDPLEELRRQVLADEIERASYAASQVAKKRESFSTWAWSLVFSAMVVGVILFFTIVYVRNFEKHGGRDLVVAKRLVVSELAHDAGWLEELSDNGSFPDESTKLALLENNSFLASDAWIDERTTLARFLESYHWTSLVSAYLKIDLAELTVRRAAPGSEYDKEVVDEFLQACDSAQWARFLLQGYLSKSQRLGCEQDYWIDKLDKTQPDQTGTSP